MQRKTIAVVGLALSSCFGAACGAEEPACAEATAHLQQCTGEAVTLGGCDAEMAGDILSQSCDTFAVASKGDAWKSALWTSGYASRASCIDALNQCAYEMDVEGKQGTCFMDWSSSMMTGTFCAISRRWFCKGWFC